MEDPIPVTKVDMLRNRPRGGRGHVIIDNRGSGGHLLELPTLTCAHCMSVVILSALRKKERGFCPHCNAYVCDDKVCAEECTPRDQVIDLLRKDPSQPWLPRAKDGSVLFDRALLEKGRIRGIGLPDPS